MNKTININLGGFPLTVDENAFDVLSQYIQNVEAYFSDSEGCEEITSDIEYRLAELIKAGMGHRAIATVSDIRSAISILGTPDMFADEQFDERNPEAENTFDETPFDKTYTKENQYTTGKKLFRNTDEQIVAGVCSGLAAYFGIQDPVWIRLAFALIALSGGAGVIAYFVLWAIVPAAKNSADRLAMKGEKINISNIAKEVESQINSLSKKISGLGKKMAPEKNKNAGYNSFGGDSDNSDPFHDLEKKIETSVDEFGNKIGGFIREVILNIGRTLKHFIKWVAVFLLIILGITWVLSTLIIVFSGGTLSMLLPFGTIGSVFFLLVTLLLIFIPLVITGFRLTGSIDNSPHRKKILTSTGVLWGMSLLIFCFSSVSWIKSFKEYTKVTHKEPLEYHQNYEINIKKPKTGNIHFGGVSIDSKNVYSEIVTINLHSSRDSTAMIEYTREARGKDKNDAKIQTESIAYDYKAEGNILSFPSHIKVLPGKEWRGQKLTVDVYIPVGSDITIDGNKPGKIGKIDFTDKKIKMSNLKGGDLKLKATTTGFEIIKE